MVVPVDLLAGERRLTEVAKTVMEGDITRRVFRLAVGGVPLTNGDFNCSRSHNSQSIQTSQVA